MSKIMNDKLSTIMVRITSTGAYTNFLLYFSQPMYTYTFFFYNKVFDTFLIFNDCTKIQVFENFYKFCRLENFLPEIFC